MRPAQLWHTAHYSPERGRLIGSAIARTLWILWLAGYWRGGLEIIRDIHRAASCRDRPSPLILTAVTIDIVIHMGVATWRGAPAQPSALSGYAESRQRVRFRLLPGLASTRSRSAPEVLIAPRG